VGPVVADNEIERSKLGRERSVQDEGKPEGSAARQPRSVSTGLETLVSTLGYAIQRRSSWMFAPSIHHGPGQRRSIALTFDDGPCPGTRSLLDYLESQNVRATFFQCGENVIRHPETARAVHLAGHEIGNHTFSHPRLCPKFGWPPNLLSPYTIYKEFARAQAVIETETGVRPRLLRAPYGLRWFGMRTVQRRFDLKAIMWTVIGRDWILPALEITERVVQGATPGGIVCLHDGRENRPNPDIDQTLVAIRRIVPLLRDQGYTFETVSDLLQPDFTSHPVGSLP